MKNVTENIKTWTYEVGKGTALFCEIQHDKAERIYNVYTWLPEFMTKYWLFGWPEDQPNAIDGKTHYTFADVKDMVEWQDWEQIESDYREEFR